MKLNGQKITFLGDSITFGIGASSNATRYSTVLSNRLSAVEHNMGISGTTLCTDGDRISRLDHVWDIPKDTRLLIVYLGTNDYDACTCSHGATYYALGTCGSTDTSTIYGASNVICQRIKLHFKENMPTVCFVTPAVSGWNRSAAPDVHTDFNPEKRNACGYTIGELSCAIEEVATSHGFVTYHLGDTLLSPSDFLDGLHPNDIGMAKIADALFAFITERL